MKQTGWALMLNVDERGMAGRQSVLAQWVSRAINLQATQVQARFRGNILHLLCEGPQCPDAAIVISRLVEALAQADLATLLPPDPYPTYQIWVYGRGFGSDRPTWSEPIYLNQLDRHLEHVRQLQPPPPDLSSFYLRQSPTQTPSARTTAAHHLATRTSATSTATTTKPSRRPGSPSSALLVPNETLARQGRPDAIARYLSETLSTMGVAVEVTAKAIPYTPGATTDNDQRNKRLWILCESAYSPDPATLAEPIAQKLRGLALETFQDALVFSQVSGEPQPEWRLRVDLTPPDEMLREWARWGDVQAIARLLNQALAKQQIQATAELKEATLHLVCRLSSDENAVLTAPQQYQVTDLLTPVLESLAPQGIHAATVYGQQANQEAPAWVAWLNLPAAEHSALAEPAIALAQQGDQPALQFLLSRLLNPNLDHRLATGGIRVQILRKGDLLHVMTDAAICPKQKRVGPAIGKFLKPLKLANLTGVRVYGRRSGQKRPLWSYGADFITRDRLVPEATPEFAASDAYVNELIAQPLEPELRPEFTTEVFQTAVSATTQKLTQGIQQFLVRSQLFVPQDHPLGQGGAHGAKVAIVWGALGLLLTLQTDWVLGQLLQARTKLANAPAPQSVTAPTVSIPEAAPSDSPKVTGVPAPPLSLTKTQSGKTTDTAVFNASGFTAADTSTDAVVNGAATTPKILKAEPIRTNATSAAILAAARSPYATFNSRQLDEKLALYHQRLTESGPPDILIIGSSRALRGVDPVTLQKALAAEGYPGLTVFNFGINGATAQVVSLVLEKVLTPDQMPKLILWADGARAFNSGRVDVTYNAIAASEGYRQMLAQGNRPGSTKTPQPTNTAPTLALAAAPMGGLAEGSEVAQTSLASSYAALNQWLNDSTAKLSSTYTQRDQLKALLQTQWSQIGKAKPTFEELLATQGQFAAPSPNGSAEGGEADSLLYAIDFDGFLPLSLRFNPATYYQKYAKVSGSYDNDYDKFELAGKQTEALESLLKFTQTHQVPLVFVNLPLTQDYLDDVRKEYEVEFRQHMLRLATENGFVFRDLGELWPTENDYFSDPSHLNRYGAYEVSHHLAKDPMIPWPRSQATPPANQY